MPILSFSSSKVMGDDLLIFELVFLYGEHAFDFRDSNHRQETREYQEQRQEQPDGAEECAHIHPGGMEVTPRGGQEVARQACGDDDEALEPHTDVGGDTDDEHDPQVVAQFLEPVELRDKDIAGVHGPGGPPVGSEGAVEESGALVDVTAVPG